MSDNTKSVGIMINKPPDPFEPFETRFQIRTGLRLKRLPSKLDGYRDYVAMGNDCELFKIGVSLDGEHGPIVGMVYTPDMFVLDPESSAGSTI